MSCLYHIEKRNVGCRTLILKTKHEQNSQSTRSCKTLQVGVNINISRESGICIWNNSPMRIFNENTKLSDPYYYFSFILQIFLRITFYILLLFNCFQSLCFIIQNNEKLRCSTIAFHCHKIFQCAHECTYQRLIGYFWQYRLLQHDIPFRFEFQNARTLQP